MRETSEIPPSFWEEVRELLRDIQRARVSRSVSKQKKLGVTK